MNTTQLINLLTKYPYRCCRDGILCGRAFPFPSCNKVVNFKDILSEQYEIKIVQKPTIKKSTIKKPKRRYTYDIFWYIYN